MSRTHGVTGSLDPGGSIWYERLTFVRGKLGTMNVKKALYSHKRMQELAPTSVLAKSVSITLRADEGGGGG